MSLMRHKRQRGDTLVEVILAFAIFGVAVVTVTRTMNTGLSRVFVSTQESQVNSIVEAQRTLLQRARDEAVRDPQQVTTGHWATLVAALASNPSSNTKLEKAVNADGCTYTGDKNRVFFPMTGSDWLVVNQVASTGNTDTAATASDVTPSGADGNSVWIEGQYTTEPGGRGYYDLYIKACWQNTGGSVDVPRQLKTVIRLYDPDSSAIAAAPGPAPGGGGGGGPSAPVIKSILGSAHMPGRCTSIIPGEGTEAGTPPLRTAPLFSVPSSDIRYPCVSLTDTPSSVFSCTNYDVGYNTGLTAAEAGIYKMRIYNKDADCAGWLAVGPPPTRNARPLNASAYGYRYQVDVFTSTDTVTWSKVTTMSIDPDQTFAEYTFAYLPANASIGFRWFNNHFIGPSWIDPNLVITNIELEKQP